MTCAVAGICLALKICLRWHSSAGFSQKHLETNWLLFCQKCKEHVFSHFLRFYLYFTLLLTESCSCVLHFWAYTTLPTFQAAIGFHWFVSRTKVVTVRNRLFHKNSWTLTKLFEGISPNLLSYCLEINWSQRLPWKRTNSIKKLETAQYVWIYS